MDIKLHNFDFAVINKNTETRVRSQTINANSLEEAYAEVIKGLAQDEEARLSCVS